MASQLSSIEHFVMYGQPGEMPKQRVLASDWGADPMEQPITSSWRLPIEAKYLSRLITGFKPEDMDDKWFIYADGPNTEGMVSVHLVRSWTGNRIAEVRIAVGDAASGTGPAFIKELVWESDPDVVDDQDVDGAKEIVRETFRWILGINLEEDSSDQKNEIDSKVG